MKIVIAPDKFKESLTAPQACEAIASGFRGVFPKAELDLIPMADGGEGTVDALLSATNGTAMRTRVSGPLGEPVEARWGLLGTGAGRDPTAVIEMASASGLALLEPDQRNPLLTTTYGTGELIRAALDAGARRIILGIGGSATTDGGAGAAQAVGVVFENEHGQPFPAGLSGGSLVGVTRIGMDRRDRRLADCRITVACDVDNPLCGPNGAAAVYGPQKGATESMVSILDANLGRLADLIREDLGKEVADIPGAGAAGGLGAGLLAFFDARLEPGVRIIMDAVDLRGRIAGADLLITGEGRLDAQSMMGKVVGALAAAGKEAGVPTIALVGSVGQDAETAVNALDGCFSLADKAASLPDAMARAAELLEQTAGDAARLGPALG